MTTMYSPLVYPQCPAGGNYARPALPSTFTGTGPAAISATWNPYSASAIDRTEYWADSAGTLTFAEMMQGAYGSLAGLQAYQQQQVANAAQAALAAIVAPYAPNEVLTWDQQVAEAQAYTASSSASTPLLSAVSTASGQTVAALAANVLSLDATYKASVGAVVGKRIKLSAAIAAATTPDAVLAATW